MHIDVRTCAKLLWNSAYNNGDLFQEGRPHELSQWYKSALLRRSNTHWSRLRQRVSPWSVRSAAQHPHPLRRGPLLSGHVPSAALSCELSHTLMQYTNEADQQQGLLHCNYWRLIDGMSAAWTDMAWQKEVHKQLCDRHSQHCFAYIAESIMCAGDLTIEWAKVERDGSRTQVDGWGVPHQCKDLEAIQAWIEVNHGPVKDGSIHLHDWWSTSLGLTTGPLELSQVVAPGINHRGAQRLENA